jgi:hypothetical protein
MSSRRAVLTRPTVTISLQFLTILHLGSKLIFLMGRCLDPSYLHPGPCPSFEPICSVGAEDPHGWAMARMHLPNSKWSDNQLFLSATSQSIDANMKESCWTSCDIMFGSPPLLQPFSFRCSPPSLCCRPPSRNCRPPPVTAAPLVTAAPPSLLQLPFLLLQPPLT